MNELKPCPFCGAAMLRDDHTISFGIYVGQIYTEFKHPKDDSCILSEFVVAKPEVEKWSRRINNHE